MTITLRAAGLLELLFIELEPLTCPGISIQLGIFLPAASEPMRLRDHPLMTYHGVRNWPPSWTWRGGENNTKLRGEVGVLRDVFISQIEPRTRLFLIIEYAGNEFIGCLMFTDGTFCCQMYDLLKQQCGKRIEDLGSLEVSRLL